VKKQQWFLAGTGIVLVALLFLFGKTVPPKKQNSEVASASSDHTAAYDIKASLSAAKANLSPARQGYVNSLENAVVRGDVKNQQVHIYHQLANFWRDSVRLFEPYAFFTAEASKLENSEKSLTFAAQLFLSSLQQDQQADAQLTKWKALQARDLFERSLKINPNNDSSKVGLGGCILFGNISDNPMEGLKMIMDVTKKDSTNIYAQMMLVQGALISGQFDKAITRLQSVNRMQPDNIEAILMLADLYERNNDKATAISWYKKSLPFIKKADLKEVIEKRINDLSK